ncbi:hypothetical protein ACVDG8_002725 [Mesorhizobium sp. ORM8.1]
MASTEFVITGEQYEDLLRHLVESGSKIGYDFLDKNNIIYLTIDTITNVTAKQNASMALKHPSFATDEPEIVIYKNGNIAWHQFKELHGDGHLKITSRKFSAVAYPYFYVLIGYTSFFVKKNGVHIQAPRNLIDIYKTAVRSIKSHCNKELIGDTRIIYVSRAIVDNDANWLSAVRTQFGI